MQRGARRQSCKAVLASSRPVPSGTPDLTLRHWLPKGADEAEITSDERPRLPRSTANAVSLWRSGPRPHDCKPSHEHMSDTPKTTHTTKVKTTGTRWRDATWDCPQAGLPTRKGTPVASWPKLNTVCRLDSGFCPDVQIWDDTPGLLTKSNEAHVRRWREGAWEKGIQLKLFLLQVYFSK